MTSSDFVNKWLRRLTMDRSEQSEFCADIDSISTTDKPVHVHEDLDRRTLILMTFDEYLGISRDAKYDPEKDPAVIQRTVCLASFTNCVVSALQLLLVKQQDYHKKYPRMRWELRLTHVERLRVPQSASDVFPLFDVQFVEDLNYED